MNQNTNSIAGAIARHGMTAGGAAAFVHSQDEILRALSLLVAVVGLIWSIVEKIRRPNVSREGGEGGSGPALLLLALCSLLFSGCVANTVPRTHIAGTLGGKPFVFDAPKDVDVETITLAADTDGKVTLTVKSLKTRMNPDVITTTGEAQEKMIKTIFDGAQQLIQAAPK